MDKQGYYTDDSDYESDYDSDYEAVLQEIQESNITEDMCDVHREIKEHIIYTGWPLFERCEVIDLLDFIQNGEPGVHANSEQSSIQVSEEWEKVHTDSLRYTYRLFRTGRYTEEIPYPAWVRFVYAVSSKEIP